MYIYPYRHIKNLSLAHYINNLMLWMQNFLGRTFIGIASEISSVVLKTPPAYLTEARY
jgi:hypothetical protein